MADSAFLLKYPLATIDERIFAPEVYASGSNSQARTGRADAHILGHARRELAAGIALRRMPLAERNALLVQELARLVPLSQIGRFAGASENLLSWYGVARSSEAATDNPELGALAARYAFAIAGTGSIPVGGRPTRDEELAMSRNLRQFFPLIGQMVERSRLIAGMPPWDEGN